MNRWERFFVEDRRVESAPPTQFVRDAAAVLAVAGAHKILDLGCGVGRDTFYLADQRFDVTGVDSADSGLEIARRLAAGRTNPPRFEKADAREPPFTAARFAAEMFESVTSVFRLIQKRVCYDVGCTGKANYLVWSGIFRR